MMGVTSGQPVVAGVTSALLLMTLCCSARAKMGESYIRVTDNGDGSSSRLLSDGEMLVSAMLDDNGHLLECNVLKGNQVAVQDLLKESIMKSGSEHTKYLLVTTDVARYGRHCRKYIRDTLRIQEEKLTPLEAEVRMRLKLDKLYKRTLWCTRNGRQVSLASSQLGEPAALDLCCQRLHQCNDTIPSYSLKHDLLNHLAYSLPSCACAEHLYDCLKGLPAEEAEFGELIFNVNRLKCFQLVEERTCEKYDMWFSGCHKPGRKKVAVMKGFKPF